MNPIFVGNTKKGKLIIQNQDKFNAYILSLGEKEVAVVVKLWRKPRSIQQNKFLWSVPYQLISEATGYTREEVHDAMRMMFLKDEDRDIPTLRSTTSLTTIEMNEYWARIQQFAAEKLNLQIPDPNEIEL
jgi:hypothetical protein